MEIIYKAKSVQDFIERLIKFITYLDSKIFDKSAKVLISHNQLYENFGTAGFVSKRWFFRIIGLCDLYLVYEKSKKIQIASNYEITAICIASHEVRHRFQKYNKESIISPNFIYQSKYLKKDLIDYVYNGNIHYLKKLKIFKKEFDASLIESIISSNYKNPRLTIEIIVELVTCNERNIGSIISKFI